jgi:hypothetical protein
LIVSITGLTFKTFAGGDAISDYVKDSNYDRTNNEMPGICFAVSMETDGTNDDF